MQLAETIENHKDSFTFGFTTCCLQNATDESYRNKAIQACLLSCTVFSANISEIQPLFLFTKVSGDLCLRESNTQNPNKYWLMQKYFGLSNDLKKSFRSF